MSRSPLPLRTVIIFGAGMLMLSAPSAPAFAQDFFQQLFGGFARPAPWMLPPGADAPASAPPRRASHGSSGQAFCVRTCDGRHFPLASVKGKTQSEACGNLCPATETKVFYGSSIDHAATRGGERYAGLPNAFRYRDELVAGCTCNGKDPGGLARVDIEDDHTLRKGDIVAGDDGLMVAGRVGRRSSTVNFSPASPQLQARFLRVPVVAAE
jgi:hypothetical protein